VVLTGGLPLNRFRHRSYVQAAVWRGAVDQ